MIKLPKIYTEELWIKGGSRQEHKQFIGKYYVSWSQIESFNSSNGFNTALLGEYEYILHYFSKVQFPDMGWGEFGHLTEAYICYKGTDSEDEHYKKSLSFFSDKEKEVLNTIEPLGTFQYEVCYYVEELDVVVLGYIDDMSPIKDKIVKKLRDYKTKSESSKKDLHKPEKYQLDLYTAYLKQQELTVSGSEYCVIERLGGAECMRGGGVDSLSIGERIWMEDYKPLTEEREKEMKEVLKNTITRISKLYTQFLKIKGYD